MAVSGVGASRRVRPWERDRVGRRSTGEHSAICALSDEAGPVFHDVSVQTLPVPAPRWWVAFRGNDRQGREFEMEDKFWSDHNPCSPRWETLR